MVQYIFCMSRIVLFLTDSASLLLIASWMNEIQQSSHQQSFMLIKALSAVLSFVIHRSLPFFFKKMATLNHERHKYCVSLLSC